MARIKSTPKCQCGCGQAPAKSCRLRKAECAGCGYVVRVSREWIAKGLPTCVCGWSMECQCLEDRMTAGDTLAYSAMLDRAAMPHSTGRRTGTHGYKVERRRNTATINADDLPF